jgi:hypothetical protein
VASDIAARFPLDRIVDAYRMLESSPHGKVLVMPRQQRGGADRSSLSP